MAKEAKWNSFCEELSAETTLTQFWQFCQQMDRNDHTKTKARLKRHQQSKVKDQQQERSSFIWVIHPAEQSKQP